ncbi:MAG: winged helix-turn-helix domain-containing protein [Gemmatimonadetes bacterium]|nr:winged helix-turn-helix domain-containing protein [Gemmatimonadota bacterium]
MELIRRACAADGCEIFLCEPEGGDLVLTACGGPDRDAMMERSRFEAGIGYPGIVGASGQPLFTRSLPRDRRFLRRRVTERGIHSYVCVPLPGPNGPVGCIGVAWRDPSAPIDRAADFLCQAAAPISTAVRAGLAAARELVDQTIDAAGESPEARRRAFLDVLVRASGARAATLALYGDPPDGGATVLSTAPVPSVCLQAVDGRQRCSPLASGHGVRLDICRDTWPDRCRFLPATTLAPCCLPLRVRSSLRGVVVLDCESLAGTPPTRDLVGLLSMARAGAARLLPATEEPVLGSTWSSTPVLEVRCFGPFEIRLLGQAVPVEAFTRRKALALLKLLILRAGNPVSRDALAERLWPGVDGKAGANRLHGVLHALRTAIEPFRDERRWIYVCNIGELYYFNMESPHWTDLYAFRRHAATAAQAARSGQHAEALRHFESAVAMYRGDLFEDEPYAGWCELERTELRHRYLEMVARLAELWVAEHEPDRAVDTLRRGLLVDPLREDLHQALIKALASLGRRREALAQYQTCERVLRTELGVDPLPETRRLERLIARPLPENAP